MMGQSALNRWGGMLSGLIVVGVGATLYAYAGDPSDTWHKKIPYQGHLEQNGVGVDGTANFEFALYFEASGGTPIWSETLGAVAVSSGVFSVTLGEDAGNAIPDSAFQRQRLYLAITVNGTPMSTRQAIMAVPFASNAASPLPPGAIIPYAGGASVPHGWLVCDGRALASADYPALFAAIGTRWGNGSTSTSSIPSGANFNLPDLRGRFLRGVDGGAGHDPNAGGRGASAAGGATGDDVGSLQGDATSLPNAGWSVASNGNHNHGMTTRQDDYNVSGGSGPSFGADNGTFSNYHYTADSGSHSHTVGGGDNETRPVNAAVLYLIHY